MYIRKSNGPKIELYTTPARTDDQFEHWPLSTLLFKKLLRRLRRLPDISIIATPHALLYQMLWIYLGSLLSLQG